MAGECKPGTWSGSPASSGTWHWSAVNTAELDLGSHRMFIRETGPQVFGTAARSGE
jgi:hypothetical protein